MNDAERQALDELDRNERWADRAARVLIVLAILGLIWILSTAFAFADAPAPKPSPRPTPRPSAQPAPIVEPLDLPPVDVPGEAQPAGLPSAAPYVAPSPLPKAKPSWWPTLDLTKWTVQLDGGIQTVILHAGEKGEFGTAAVEFAGPLSGFDLWQRTELLGEQDGGRLDFSNAQSFRAVLVNGKVSRAVGGKLAFAILGGTTFSVEGGQFAPADSRLWTLQGEASVKLRRLIVSAYGGHDGAIGGFGLGGSVAIPVMGGRPQILTSFDYPLSKPAGREAMPLPWQFKAGARIIIAKEFLSELF